MHEENDNPLGPEQQPPTPDPLVEETQAPEGSMGELIPEELPQPEIASTLAPADRINLDELRDAAVGVRAEIGKLIVGQKDFIDLLIASLLAGGHVLVEGVPGIAKTLTAKLLAKTIAADYSRIQFTP
ncbi:MAG: MoxR family ATPase, partial [Bacteroidota bacterium]